MSTHPLANDATVPAVLRKAFARVQWQVIATLSDGTESIVNCMSESKVSEVTERNRDIIRVHAQRGYGFTHGPSMIATRVESVA